MKKLKDILNSSEQFKSFRTKKRKYDIEYNNGLDFLKLVERWDQVVGEKLALNTRPLKLNRGQLLVITKHATYASQLNFLMLDIIKKIEQNFPNLKGSIQKIRFRASNSFYENQLFDQIEQTKNSEKDIKTTTYHQYSPDFRLRQEQAKKLYQDIEDDGLKQALIDLYIQCPNLNE